MSARERYSSEARVRVRAHDEMRRLKAAPFTPLLAAMAPFLPAPAFGAIGVGAGVFAANRLQALRTLRKPPELAKQHRFAGREETGIADRIYLGHSIDFLTYKSGLEALRERQGRLTAEERTDYDNSVIAKMFPSFTDDKNMASHMALLGSPGQGKTEFLLSLCYQQAKRGGGMIIFDPKSDDKVFARIAEIMRLTNREHDLRYFNPDRPNQSHTYNPLLFGDARHVVSTGMKLTKTPTGGDSDFFYRMTRIGMLAAVVCLKAQPEWTPISFQDLAPLFSDLGLFAELYQRIPDENVDAKAFVYQFLRMWLTQNRQGQLGPDYQQYLKVLAGLKGMVMDFCHGPYIRLLNSYNPDIDLKDVIENGRVLYVGFSALSDKQGSNVFGRLLMADAARALGEIYTQRVRPAVSCMMFMDEYGSSADEADLELFQMGRDANVPIVAAVQGRGFLDTVNQHFVSKLLDATGSQLFLRVSSEESRSTAAALAGTIIARFGQGTDSRNFGSSHKNFETGMLNQESHGRSVSVGSREMREDLLQPEDFALAKGDAILFSSSGVHRMRLPLLTFKTAIPPSEKVWLPRFARPEVKGLDLMRRSMEHDTHFLQAFANGALEDEDR